MLLMKLMKTLKMAKMQGNSYFTPVDKRLNYCQLSGKQFGNIQIFILKYISVLEGIAH